MLGPAVAWYHKEGYSHPPFHVSFCLLLNLAPVPFDTFAYLMDPMSGAELLPAASAAPCRQDALPIHAELFPSFTTMVLNSLGLWYDPLPPKKWRKRKEGGILPTFNALLSQLQCVRPPHAKIHAEDKNASRSESRVCV